MYLPLSYALRAVALYITGAIIIGTIRDPSLTWLHAVGFSAPTIGACSFVFFMFNQKPTPLDTRLVRKKARVPFFTCCGLVLFAAAYVSAAVHPQDWEDINALSAIHLLVFAYAGEWALAVALVLAGAMCLDIAFEALMSRAIRW